MPTVMAHLNSAINTIERWAKRSHLLSYPSILQIELSSSCNLTCTICARSEFPYGPGYFPLSSFSSLVPAFPYVKKLILHGYGEPLMHPKFPEIMEIIGPHSCHKSFYTNGTLLSGKRVDAIFQGNIDEIAVSIDTPHAPTFESIRTGASFRRIVENIDNFIAKRDARKKAKRPRVILATVAMTDTVQHLPSLVDFAASLGVDAVEVNYLMAYKKSLVKKSLYFLQEQSNIAFIEAKERAKRHGMELRLPALFSLKKTHEGPRPQNVCPRLYDFIYIGYDANVRPCCFPLLFVGNISNESIKEIWNGKAYQNLRESFAKRMPPQFCGECLTGTYTDVDSEKCHISCEMR